MELVLAAAHGIFGMVTLCGSAMVIILVLTLVYAGAAALMVLDEASTPAV